MSALLWLNLFSMVHAFEINDFRLGIQLCNGNGGENVGETEETRWLRNGGGWSSWAIHGGIYDSNGIYENPDCARIGVFGRHNSAYDDAFEIEDTDIRFCIQLTDDAYDETGNTRYIGYTKCTPWASAGGGWSDWAGDHDYEDYDAVRVRIQTRYQPGLLITDVRAGIRVTDVGTASWNAGFEEKTEWVIGAQVVTHSWSEWASSKGFIDPDAIKIYLGVMYAFVDDDDDEDSAKNNNEQASVPIPHDEIEEHSKGISSFATHEMVIICIVGLVVIVCVSVTGYVFWRNRKKRNDHSPVYLDDSDDDYSSDELDTVTQVELEGIAKSENKNTITQI